MPDPLLVIHGTLGVPGVTFSCARERLTVRAARRYAQELEDALMEHAMKALEARKERESNPDLCPCDMSWDKCAGFSCLEG